MHFLATPPLGLVLSHSAKTVARAMEEAMAQAGGSIPAWQILLTLKTQPVANQRELAAAVGIQDATLTHHLNAMENDGLLARRRDPANRRVHLVELTKDGEALFHTLRKVAVAFDQRLRTGLDEAETATLVKLLGKLRTNVMEPQDTDESPAR
ncbi:MarR family winged helix-turn-helix transcriptional regulator [Actinokineospora sp. NBRC 105648]|uniref:MarR family winged helix-turn-helix transcriptional regulator n=1 Tax=Actinokineospora sp. NBRC 105648 TaxID=3032206 RepID=UPI0024A17A42|nr:MarR family winged helix-turn-helix transcriptional regulator [Actinokineospora sp. NBRC 105648]GLZ43372.1 transcriptional regulator [Actinokineospora sp. NBRC 105648]